MSKMKGYVAFEDGTVFEGLSFGAEGVKPGEVIFNTSMTGYQEILTDPSYSGQIITMTYPLIGNYGINTEDVESGKIQCEGFVVREYCEYPSNYRSSKTLAEYLVEAGKPGVCDIDTRALTRHIRTAGAMRGVIAAGNYTHDELVDIARASESLVGRDLVDGVSCTEEYTFSEDCYWMGAAPEKKFNVAVYDYGVKKNILRCLCSVGCNVKVYPAKTPASKILQDSPDGVFLSNGPGDPAAVTYAIESIRELAGKLPMMGICLGHQLAGLALGAKTHKLKFGHRGSNHPVRNEKNGKVEITSQNHGFIVDIDTFPLGAAEITHMNLNDHTVEGLRHKEMPLFSVQYHPEASAGPHDPEYLFHEFTAMMEANR